MIPKCQICGKAMVHAVDRKTNELSEYLWQTDCEHTKNLRLSIG